MTPGAHIKRFLLAASLLASSAFPAAAAGAAESGQFVPLFRTDFPDPFIIRHNGEYLAYATNTARGRINVQMASSPDLLNWQSLKDPNKPAELLDAMPVLPVWAKKGYTWAPEVLETGGRYILYFTARHKKSDLQCVGAAASTDPRGPFTDPSSEPLVCQFELGGTIDAAPFRDSDGQLYLYFKNDGNHPSANKPAEIWGQRLSADGMRLVGEPISLLRNDKPWEAHLVEAPTMVRTPTGYTMLFSANDYGWREEHQRLSPYAMGYATCRGPMGPCADAPDNPLLYSFSDPKLGCLSGPGHQAVFNAGNRSFIAFHGWAATSGCRKLDSKRYMYISPLGWRDGKPQIAPSLRPAGSRD